jgi:hypothetical protein
MFNFKRFVAALIGLLTLCAIDAHANSFVITNVSGFLTSGLGVPAQLRCKSTTVRH